MKKILLSLLSIVMLLNSLSTFGWGPKGHDVVAAIAEEYLSEQTQSVLYEVLDGHSIVYYSSWMDNIQNSPDWETTYSHTKTWHYANVDKGKTYQTMKKNEKGDVLANLKILIEEAKAEIIAADGNLYAVSPDRIKMIIHMVGDMHCPMHAGRLSDLGGNLTKVRWFGRNTNLHSVWDSKMIDAARQWSYSEWREQLLSGIDAEMAQMITGGSDYNPDEWFYVTVERAAKIYNYVECLEEENPNLSYQFVYDFSPMLEESLLEGGLRLAHVLNSIFDPNATLSHHELAEMELGTMVISE